MQLHSAEYEWPNGEPGSPIHGSQFYRGYCPGCGAPMRVIDPKWANWVWCERCTLRPQTGGLAAPRVADGSDDDGYGTVYTHLRTQIDQWGEPW